MCVVVVVLGTVHGQDKVIIIIFFTIFVLCESSLVFLMFKGSNLVKRSDFT